MFSDAYRKVKFFGQWAEDTADAFGQRDALAVLQDASERCNDQDMRTEDVEAALAYLEAHTTRQGAFKRFRMGLAIRDPFGRSRAVSDALAAIWRILGSSTEPKVDK